MAILPVMKDHLSWGTTKFSGPFIQVPQQFVLEIRWQTRISDAEPSCDFLRASYQIREIAGCTCAGNDGNVSPATDFKWNR